MKLTENNIIMVTNWEKVEADDFYLTDEKWAKNVNPEDLQLAKELQADGKLYLAYTVSAVHYAIYKTMDASQIFIDDDGNEILSCESAIIEDKHKHVEEYSL